MHLMSMTDSEFQRLSETIKLLGTPARLRILAALSSARGGEMHVGQLTEVAGCLSQPATSHHISILRAAGLIEPRRDGKFNYYALRRDRLAAAAALIASFVADPAPAAQSGGKANGRRKVSMEYTMT